MLKTMNALQKIYALRIVLGVVAAVICVLYGWASGSITTDASEITINTLINGITLALVTYLVSYYIIKRRFMFQVEKAHKLVTTGIGIYFITWLVFWVLLYTVVALVMAAV